MQNNGFEFVDDLPVVVGTGPANVAVLVPRQLRELLGFRREPVEIQGAVAVITTDITCCSI